MNCKRRALPPIQLVCKVRYHPIKQSDRPARAAVGLHRPRLMQGLLVKETSVKLYTYLNYGGDCRQAFEVYDKHLGGRITSVATHGEQPEANEVPPDWKNAVLHARIELGETILLGADIPPDRFQPMRSAYLSL